MMQLLIRRKLPILKERTEQRRNASIEMQFFPKMVWKIDDAIADQKMTNSKRKNRTETNASIEMQFFTNDGMKDW